jgi:hypothetical protein
MSESPITLTIRYRQKLSDLVSEDSGLTAFSFQITFTSRVIADTKLHLRLYSFLESVVLKAIAVTQRN